ncbi:hypothetical protein VNO77_14116 [Canavalia gladiata]|uniref:Uncharacterized protein n=1 Tax=Canavalia gladiata TaxID=3824 RepID=A0AAN9M2E6_CANGL
MRNSLYFFSFFFVSSSSLFRVVLTAITSSLRLTSSSSLLLFAAAATAITSSALHFSLLISQFKSCFIMCQDVRNVGREEDGDGVEGGEGDGVEDGEGDGDKGGQSESECEEVDMFGGYEASEKDDGGAGNERKIKEVKCSACGDTNHNRQTCVVAKRQRLAHAQASSAGASHAAGASAAIVQDEIVFSESQPPPGDEKSPMKLPRPKLPIKKNYSKPIPSGRE